MKHKQKTSWQPVSRWYTQAIGDQGGYFHQRVVFPKLLDQLKLKAGDKVLDLGCGQGVFERQLAKTVGYLGLDVAPDLIKYATEHRRWPEHQFQQLDLTRPWPIKDKDFTHALMILSAQNIDQLDRVLVQAEARLQPKARLVLVLNHPCFRIPRQSSWGIDPQNKLQFRRVNRYLSPLKIPITAHPGKRNSALTWSFHLSLSTYSQYLSQAGFVITQLEEWGSDKTSQGKAAKMENRARDEFPLFLTIFAQKSPVSGEHMQKRVDDRQN